MLDDLQKFRIEFARVSNVVLSHEMRDDDRRAYWLEILEPVWDNLKLSWHMEGGIPRDEWEAVVRSALVGVLTPAQWRSVSWRKKADAKALKFSEKRKESRQKKQEDGVKDNTHTVNTRAFWQEQSFGAASPVTKIDPSTYKIED